MLRYFLIFFVLVLLFIPIPIKITVKFFDKKLYLYIYKIKIDVFAKIKEKPVCEETKKKRSFTEKLLPEDKLDTMKLLLSRLNSSKFKPTIRLNININYGFGDAAQTGIFYGIIYSFSSLLYYSLKVIFKMKKYKLNAEPDFDKETFSSEIKSIIFVSIAKIIYIAYLIANIVIKSKKSEKSSSKKVFNN